MNTVLSDGAKKDLLDLVKRQGKISLEAATQALQLAKTTVRQHLLAMESQGLVKRKYERAGQGRPKVVFELAQGGQRLYPTQEPQLLRELIEYLKAEGQQNAIRDFFEKYWAKRRLRLEALLQNGGTRMQALLELLESEGFMPQINKSGNRITVRECHCPFPEAIRATQLPCKLESEFIKWALKTTVDRTGYLPNGDSACTYSGKMK